MQDGTFLTYDDIEIDETTTVYRLRKLQDSTFGDADNILPEQCSTGSG
jgi:predicted homoserine dehydrogenase-like protein